MLVLSVMCGGGFGGSWLCWDGGRKALGFLVLCCDLVECDLLG